VVRVLLAIETFIGDANQLIGVLGVLREDGDAVVHTDADGKLKRLDHFGKNSLDAAAERKSLRSIGLRYEATVAAYAEGDRECGASV
jgi:hypothetical protein